jgi:hypothetical protein
MSPTDRKTHEGGSLRGVALYYARVASMSAIPTWLLTVDDDEFVLPWRSAAPLCRYLASPEASRYKQVGTNSALGTVVSHCHTMGVTRVTGPTLFIAHSLIVALIWY